MDAVSISWRLTKQISSALEISMSLATFWMNITNVIFWTHGQSCNLKPFVSHPARKIYQQSSSNQWVFLKQNSAEHGTTGLTLWELADAETSGGKVERFYWSQKETGLSENPPNQRSNWQKRKPNECRPQRNRLRKQMKRAKLTTQIRTALLNLRDYRREELAFKPYKILQVIPSCF